MRELRPGEFSPRSNNSSLWVCAAQKLGRGQEARNGFRGAHCRQRASANASLPISMKRHQSAKIENALLLISSRIVEGRSTARRHVPRPRKGNLKRTGGESMVRSGGRSANRRHQKQSTCAEGKSNQTICYACPAGANLDSGQTDVLLRAISSLL